MKYTARLKALEKSLSGKPKKGHASIAKMKYPNLAFQIRDAYEKGVQFPTGQDLKDLQRSFRELRKADLEAPQIPRSKDQDLESRIQELEKKKARLITELQRI